MNHLETSSVIPSFCLFIYHLLIYRDHITALPMSLKSFLNSRIYLHHPRSWDHGYPQTAKAQLFCWRFYCVHDKLPTSQKYRAWHLRNWQKQGHSLPWSRKWCLERFFDQFSSRLLGSLQRCQSTLGLGACFPENTRLQRRPYTNTVAMFITIRTHSKTIFILSLFLSLELISSQKYSIKLFYFFSYSVPVPKMERYCFSKHLHRIVPSNKRSDEEISIHLPCNPDSRTYPEWISDQYNWIEQFYSSAQQWSLF